MKKVVIYTLSDPRNGLVRYVGRTSSIKLRMKAHNSRSVFDNLEKRGWMLELRSMVLAPRFEILEEIEGAGYVEEEFWIAQFKAWGFPLFNKTEGGMGCKMKASPETIEKKRKIIKSMRESGWDPRKGKLHSLETKERMRKAKIGVKKSAQHCASIAAYQSPGTYKIFRNDAFLGEFPSTPKAEFETGISRRTIFDLSISGKTGKIRNAAGVRVEFQPKK
jgi:hypothetical protein